MYLGDSVQLLALDFISHLLIWRFNLHLQFPWRVTQGPQWTLNEN